MKGKTCKIVWIYFVISICDLLLMSNRVYLRIVKCDNESKFKQNTCHKRTASLKQEELESGSDGYLLKAVKLSVNMFTFVSNHPTLWRQNVMSTIESLKNYDRVQENVKNRCLEVSLLPLVSGLTLSPFLHFLGKWCLLLGTVSTLLCWLRSLIYAREQT